MFQISAQFLSEIFLILRRIIRDTVINVLGYSCNITYRVSIKSFHDYKHLLQETCMEYKRIFFYHYLSMFLKFYVMCLL